MKYTLTLLFGLSFIAALGQFKPEDQKTFFGIEYKPIFSSNFFTTGPNFGFENNLTYSLHNTSGSSIGMVVRQNVVGKFSIESGINIITRNYHLELSDDTSSFTASDDFKLVSYEIPVLGLVYVQAGERVFINAGTGFSFNFLPTELSSFQPNVYSQLAVRKGWVKMALLAQLGAEYRTENSGIFYLGSSFHLPFNDLAVSRAERIKPGNRPRVSAPLAGRFLTLSIRYFFGPTPKEKAAKK